MKPRFKWLAALSALLFVATVGLWARSHFATDALERSDLVANDTTVRSLRNVSQLERHRAIISSQGKLTWAEAKVIPLRNESRLFGRWMLTDGRSIYIHRFRRQDELLHRLGFDHYDNEPPIPPRVGLQWMPSRIITIPYWLPALCFAVAPATYLLRRLRAWRRRRRGLCPECGYNLQATPDRCPECGTTVSSPPTDQ